MSAMSRRGFLGGSAWAVGWAIPLLRNGRTSASPTAREFGGANLAGWTTAVGDATRPGMGQVTEADIATVHFPDYSELRANVASRADIMAHNMTYRKELDAACLEMVHVCEYQFQLPYLPATGNTDRNGQTIEGAISLWDGQDTRRLTVVGWQWIVNPFWESGTLNCWTPGKAWQKVGSLPVDDTDWHTIRLVLDPVRRTAAMQFDGVTFPTCAAGHDGPPDFGSDVSATLAAEAISIDPGDSLLGGKLHEVRFRNWSWVWEPASACSTFLPLVVSRQ